MEYIPKESELIKMGFKFQDKGCYYEKSLDSISEDFIILRFHYHWFLEFQGQNRILRNATKKDIKRLIELFSYPAPLSN